MFAVARLNSTTNDGRIMGMDDGNNNGGDPGLSIDDASPRFHRVSTSTVNYTSPLDATVGRSGIFSSFTSGTSLGVGVDGDYRTTTITAGGGMRGDILMIGYGNLTVVGALPGDLQEVIWYKRSLSTTERNQVETYLSLKHGITLGGNGGTSATYSFILVTSCRPQASKDRALRLASSQRYHRRFRSTPICRSLPRRWSTGHP